MSLADTSVNRPVTVAVIAVLLILIALIMVPNLAVDQFPDIDMPVIMVRTTYSGASALEVEESVTKILEQQLSNVSGLETMTSTSSEGSSMIMLEFTYDRDLDDATNDIRDYLDRVKNSLPGDSASPTIFKFDSSSMPILRLIMEGEETEATLKRLAEDVVEPRLERIEGIASADVTGGETRAIRVDLSLNRLEAYGLTASQVASALSEKNVQISSGELTVDQTVYDLRVDESFSSLEDIKRTVVTTVSPSSASTSVNRSTVVRLEDIADVYEGTEDSSNVVYVNGNPAIQIRVSNESDTNSVQIAEAVREALPSINQDLPNGVSVSILYDDTTYVSSVLNQVYTSAWQGILLAMAVLFLFLRNWRTTIIIGFSIPISILVTLMFMYFFDLTLNMISLTGLILGLGMIVDNSIVILENIYKYRERGAKLRTAAILGSREMMTAIMASTLTTLSVFVPMIIWGDALGMIGQLFGDLIFTIVIALIVSFISAITIVPAMSAKFIKIYTPQQRPIKIRFLAALNDFGEKILTGLEDGYTKALAFALNNRLLVLTFVVVVLGMSVAHFSTLGMNLMPRGSSDDSVSVSLSLPVGTSTERTEKLLLQMKDIIEEEVEGYERLLVEVGGGGFFGGTADNEGSIEIMLPQPEDQIDSPQEIQEKLRPYTTIFPDADITFSSGRGPGSSSPIDVVVYSDDLDLAYESATEIRNLILEEVPLAVDPVTDLDEGVPEYQIVIDEDRANAYGLSATDVADAIDYLVDGTTPTSYWDDATELDIIVRLRAEDRVSLADLNSLFILSSSGEEIALSNVASFEEGQGPKEINREDETRLVHVTADLADGVTATEAMTVIEDLVTNQIVLPDGVSVSYGGDTQDIQELSGPLMTVIVVAILMVFAVMASLFESLSDPFIIFFSIPLLFVGVIGIYLVTGESFSLFSIIGMVVLVGIVVNNGIVLVDYTNLLRKRGTPLRQAVLQAGHNRLRPVLMTSLTTILSMVPLAFFPGEGTEMIRPIGQTIVGGLAGSTLITLFVTPIVYSLVNHERSSRRTSETPPVAAIEEETPA